jgi:hypothetical protein
MRELSFSNLSKVKSYWTRRKMTREALMPIERPRILIKEGLVAAEVAEGDEEIVF